MDGKIWVMPLMICRKKWQFLRETKIYLWFEEMQHLCFQREWAAEGKRRTDAGQRCQTCGDCESTTEDDGDAGVWTETGERKRRGADQTAGGWLVFAFTDVCLCFIWTLPVFFYDRWGHLNKALFLLFKQEIRCVEHGICPIAEFTSPLLSCAAILAIRP